jgi:hypothetical protein
VKEVNQNHVGSVETTIFDSENWQVRDLVVGESGNFGRTIKIVMLLSACSWRSVHERERVSVLSRLLKGMCGSIFKMREFLRVSLCSISSNPSAMSGFAPNFSEIPNLSNPRTGKVLVCGRCDSASDGLRNGMRIC